MSKYLVWLYRHVCTDQFNEFYIRVYISENVIERIKNWYKTQAIAILESLASPTYRAKEGSNANFLLKHSVGSIAHGFEIDVPLIYADYYFLEALQRYQKMLGK